MTLCIAVLLGLSGCAETPTTVDGPHDFPDLEARLQQFAGAGNEIASYDDGFEIGLDGSFAGAFSSIVGNLDELGDLFDLRVAIAYIGPGDPWSTVTLYQFPEAEQQDWAPVLTGLINEPWKGLGWTFRESSAGGRTVLVGVGEIPGLRSSVVMVLGDTLVEIQARDEGEANELFERALKSLSAPNSTGSLI